MFGERISPGPANQRSFLCLPCCWGANAINATALDPSGLSMLCLSPYQRVFYALASWCPSQRTRDSSKRRGQIACVRQNTYGWTSEPKSSLILTGGSSLWPFCSSVQGGCSRIWCSTVCENSTLSEDASEVLVQPLPCGTEKANSVARVVVKLTPRLCNRCASYT